MSRSQIIAGLDVGTSSIKVLVAEKVGNEWEVLSYAKIPSFGLRRGSVVNVEEILNTMKENNEKVKRLLAEVITLINDNDCRCKHALEGAFL